MCNVVPDDLLGLSALPTFPDVLVVLVCGVEVTIFPGNGVFSGFLVVVICGFEVDVHVSLGDAVTSLVTDDPDFKIPSILHLYFVKSVEHCTLSLPMNSLSSASLSVPLAEDLFSKALSNQSILLFFS